MTQTCEHCDKKLYKGISKRYSTIKWVGRFLALLPCYLCFNDSVFVNLGIIVVSFVAFIVVELVCMKIAPSLK